MRSGMMSNSFTSLLLQIDYEWVTGTGAGPGDYILETAKEQNCDMIVMGARGLGKLKKAFMGSVSDHILRKAKVPVLICRLVWGIGPLGNKRI